ncbi:MAG: hypothetical protein ACREKI_09025, partial [Gemmatimonadota bacterium]
MSPLARLAIIVGVLPVACGELPPPEPRGHFTFGVFGDGPYTGGELARFRRLLDDVNRTEISFLIHVGDLLWYPCSDEALLERRDALSTLSAPVVYTPGDNEWTDCHERLAGGYAPLERLSAVRRIYFADTTWSGVSRLRPTSQAADLEWAPFVENVRWEVGGIVFATLHVVGSDNGFQPFPGRSADDDAEARTRTRAALAWMRETFAIATEQDARAVVFAMHADPDFERASVRSGAYAPFLSALETEAMRFGRRVLLVHGDSHEQRADRPLRTRDSGDTVPNLLRLETYG